METKTYLFNAFSLQMLEGDATVRFKVIDKLPDGLTSAVGHPDTAAVLGVEYNRIDVNLHPGDVAYVAQLCGDRLQPDQVLLPEDLKFKYYKAEVLPALTEPMPNVLS